MASTAIHRIATALRAEDLRNALRDNVQASGVLFVLIAVIVATGLHSSLFVGIDNIKVLAMNMAFVGIAGVGMAILIITANVDLSVGSALGLTAVLAAILSKVVPVPLAFVFASLIGGGIGALNGVLVWNVPTSPLIITLGSMTLLQGVLFVVSGGQPVLNIPNSFVAFANEQPAGVPMPVWIFIAVAILGYFFLTFTRTGRHCYAIGGNKAAGLAAGVKVRRIVIGVFVVNGILVGLVGALEASLYGSPDQTYGTGFELQVITAVIVGGVSFMGGEGGIIRAMLGVALLTVVGGAIVSFGIDANYAYVVNGAILIVAVSVDTIVQRQRDRRQRILGRREAATGHQPPLPVLNAPAPADTTTADIALAAPHALSADQLNELIGLRREVTLLRRERDLLKAAVAGEGDDDDR